MKVRATSVVRQFLAAVAIIIAAAVLVAGCGNNSAGQQTSPTQSNVEPLKIGVIPYEDPSKLQAEYQPFADYIGKQVGRPAQVFVAQDYLGVIQALQADQIDCAYLNPLSYVLFADKMRNSPEHLVPIAMPYVYGSLYYYGVIFTKVGSGIDSVGDLKGKKFAFTDATSTSGYLYPCQYMLQHGIDPKKDLAQEYFASDTGVVPAVLNGSADAGSVFEEGLKLFTARTPGDYQKLKVLARVGPIANGMLVARGNLDPATITAITNALTTINTDPNGQAALKALQITKWAPADDSVFDPVRQAATVLGLTIQSLHAGKKK